MEKRWFMVRRYWSHLKNYYQLDTDIVLLNWLNTNKLYPQDIKIISSSDQVTIYYFLEKELPPIG